MSTTVDWKKLAEPFDPKYIRKKPGPGGRKLDFISHGVVTQRLNEVDPNWSSEVLTEHIYKDAQGRLHCEGVTIRLTVGGVSREEAGGPQRQDGFANEIKNAYSDALKRAAMRFGVALGMWESLVDSENDEDYQAENLAPVSQPSRPQPRDPAPTPAREPIAPQEVALKARGKAMWEERHPGQEFSPAQPGMIAPGQIAAITRMCNEMFMVVDDRVVADFNKGSLSLLTQDEAGKLIGDLDKELRVHRAANKQKELVSA